MTLRDAGEEAAISTLQERSVVDVAALWDDFGRGDVGAQSRLLSAYYDEFRSIARRVLRDDGGQLALQPTDLAHEAAIRILKLDRINWRDRNHFLALSARVMRQTLLDEVRRFKAGKRQPVEVTTQWPLGGVRQALPLDLLDGALEGLFQIDANRARVVELRFYAGLTLEEIAETLGVSESTIVRRWRAARAWLLQAISELN
jgi:RNA polymerase sigma factor (TIGR02999 family)